MSIFYSILEGLNLLVIIYIVIVNGIYFMLLAVSFFHIRRYKDIDRIFKLKGVYSTNLYKPISIIAPAYNEEESIISAVNSLLNIKYTNYEVVVVNDGSSDQTLQRLIKYYQLKPQQRHRPQFLNHERIKNLYTSDRYPKLVVIDKENGGKADALNAGINIANKDLFCAVDADSILEPDALTKMLRVFMEDDTTIAVGGVVRVANGCSFKNRVVDKVNVPDSFLGKIQSVEYLRAFLYGRIGLDYLDSLLIISGAFGLFNRKAVIKVGGYLRDTVGEDMELVMRLHEHYRRKKTPYRIRFISEPVCWTEVPEDRASLERQRNRWHRGITDSLYRYKKMLLNPRYGRIGLFAMPFFFFVEMLAPVIEFAGYFLVGISWWMGVINGYFALLFLAVALVWSMVLSVAAVFLEELTSGRYERPGDTFILAGYALLENLGYRQLHAWWRLKGFIDFFRGKKEWGTMVRKGLDSQS